MRGSVASRCGGGFFSIHAIEIRRFTEHDRDCFRWFCLAANRDGNVVSGNEVDSIDHIAAAAGVGKRGAQILDLARRIAASVQQRFGVALEPEPRLVGAAW